MKRAWLLSLTVLFAGPGLCRGQHGGNVGFAQPGGSKARAQQAERAKPSPGKYDVPPTKTSMFVEADVLMNVKADEFVVTFGVAREGETVEECGKKMDATIKAFSDALKPMGVAGDDLYVDFITQNKIYAFEVKGDLAKEKLVGFELKKNVSIHYKDPSLLDRFLVAAARAEVFDLVKVDYIVTDPDHARERLTKEAARVIKKKMSRYEDLLGIKLRPPGQVYAERAAVYFPTEMYDSYVAQESEEINSNYYRQKYTVQSARKGRTMFFNALDANGFDDVINPVVVEPVVQFTLHLKLRYEIEPPARAK